MTRQEYVLAVLAAGDGDEVTTTQVQKLFFLLDRKVPEQVGGPWFDFQPEAYGPFDLALAKELKALRDRQFVAMREERTGQRFYRVTAAGRVEGHAQLAKLPTATADYIRQLSAWVSVLPFDTLVASILQEFPETHLSRKAGRGKEERVE
jgi:hypothetical protein